MKIFVAVLAVAVFVSGAAFAQATSPDRPAASQSSSSQSQSQSSQSNMADQTITGCIARGADQAMVLQPDSGGAAIKLSGSSSDLSSNLNHQARITGHYEASQSASASASNPSSVAGNPSSSAQAGSDFVVSKVESVSDNCSAKSNPSSTTPPSSNTPPPAVR